MGIYALMFALTMFIGSIVVFVRRNKKEYPSDADTTLELLIVFMAALFWMVTVPAIAIVGSAWLVSKLFKVDWRSKK
jgi:hypothetical protein